MKKTKIILLGCGSSLGFLELMAIGEKLIKKIKKIKE